MAGKKSRKGHAGQKGNKGQYNNKKSKTWKVASPSLEKRFPAGMWLGKPPPNSKPARLAGPAPSWFECWPLQPVELRNMIWEYTLTIHGRRLLIVQEDKRTWWLRIQNILAATEKVYRGYLETLLKGQTRRQTDHQLDSWCEFLCEKLSWAGRRLSNFNVMTWDCMA